MKTFIDFITGEEENIIDKDDIRKQEWLSPKDRELIWKDCEKIVNMLVTIKFAVEIIEEHCPDFEHGKIHKLKKDQAFECIYKSLATLTDRNDNIMDITTCNEYNKVKSLNK